MSLLIYSVQNKIAILLLVSDEDGGRSVRAL
jgi:hypothetical protein